MQVTKQNGGGTFLFSCAAITHCHHTERADVFLSLHANGLCASLLLQSPLLGYGSVSRTYIIMSLQRGRKMPVFFRKGNKPKAETCPERTNGNLPGGISQSPPADGLALPRTCLCFPCRHGQFPLMSNLRSGQGSDPGASKPHLAPERAHPQGRESKPASISGRSRCLLTAPAPLEITAASEVCSSAPTLPTCRGAAGRFASRAGACYTAEACTHL